MVKTSDGKYSFIVDENSNVARGTMGRVQIRILRYGEEWWNDSHPVFPWKAIHSLIYHCEELEAKIKELEKK